MEHLISMYIDNELDLDDKINFVEEIHREQEYKNTTISLLEQEKLLHTALRVKSPAIAKPISRRAGFFPFLAKTARIGLAASFLIVFVFLFKEYLHNQAGYEIQPVTTAHRFVIYQTGIQRVEIAGSFTNWQRVSLQRDGTSGYWETTLQLPAGEHRFVYILDGSRLYPDPTVPVQESDDYGTANSILSIGVRS
jgi:hypothetical protein